MRLGVEQEHGGSLQVGAVPQPETLDHAFIGLVQSLGRQSLALDAPVPVFVEDPAIEIGERDARQGHVVPAATVLFEQEARQCRALQHLLGASAAVVDPAPVADRVGVRLHHDLDVFQAGVVRLQVDLDHDSEEGSDLVGDVLHQREYTRYSDDLAAVVLADLENAALRVREPTDPREVLVAPRALPLDVL